MALINQPPILLPLVRRIRTKFPTESIAYPKVLSFPL